ncbi:uncharacterized protein LOC126810218 [Patella vulgata]|uniref:uncharacterized protein LOC126810218 n=1 Tax=Patella vulgata TaxID=6465 RepID=UPI002180757D|nr:uncharacterized protein LOC126810218 [Patella vulgata]
MDPSRICLILLLILDIVYSEEIVFESGVSFQTVNKDALPNPSDYDDVENTGSYLFDAGVDGNEKKRLSLSVLVQDFKSANSRYFRAHPAFISCVQKVMMDLQNQDKSLMVYNGFLTKADTGNRNGKQERYGRSGTGVTLTFKPGVGGAQTEQIATAALKHCPVMFERLQRSLGVVMVGDNAVHLHMTSTQNAAPFFGIDGYTRMTLEVFKSWCLDQIDLGLDPIGSPDCSKVKVLQNGQIYPSDVTTPQEVVGDVDAPITRDSDADFSTLVQYQGRNIDFVNAEKSAAWCGKPGTPCVDCGAGPVGNSLNQRCTARLMSQRMYNVVNRLQKMVRADNEKLKIEKAFDEKYEGHEADFDVTSLHTEGRMVVATLASGVDPAKIQKLAQLAICAKADFVKNEGDKVIIAVKKMYGNTAQKIAFPNIELLRVEPPAADKQLYSLPKGFDEDDEATYPLMDSNNQHDELLADDTPLGLFVSKDPSIRYFRLEPRVASCYAQMVYNLNKHNKDGDPRIELEVVRGFMSTQEQLLKFDPSDKRYNTMTLGTGFEVRYSASNTKTRPLHTLVKLAVEYCGPTFHESDKQEIGIGLYSDRIFIDVRTDFDVWTKFPEQMPTEYKSLADYREDMLQRFELAVQNRIVDPDNLEEACVQANHPGLQSPNFVHSHPSHVTRRRRAAGDPDDCLPVSDTAFCKNTLVHRQTEVAHIWEEVERKWLYHNRDEVKEALEGCFITCGTCLQGNIYDDKSENCNNFLHWVNFDLMNYGPDVTNIFPRDSMELRHRACRSGHCIEDAPLFHLIVHAAEAIYRPDPKASVENELFPQAENPSPVLQLLSRLYAIHASGIVKFWVRDENDMLSLKAPLEVAMLYNKNVTKVQVFVNEDSKRDAVENVIQTYVADWSSIGCPKYTREVIAPSDVLPMPSGIGKRSPRAAIREDIINHYTSWESRWINRDI